MAFLLDVALHGLPSIPRICRAYRRGEIPSPDFVRAVMGRHTQERANLLADADPERQQIQDYASDAEEWFLARSEAALSLETPAGRSSTTLAPALAGSLVANAPQ